MFSKSPGKETCYSEVSIHNIIEMKVVALISHKNAGTMTFVNRLNETRQLMYGVLENVL